MAIVLAGGAVLTVNGANEFLPAADIRIEGDTISAVGAADSLAQPGDTLIDCREALITPGLVNVHTHAATAFYRGMAEDRPREFWSAGYAMPGAVDANGHHLVLVPAGDYSLGRKGHDVNPPLFPSPGGTAISGPNDTDLIRGTFTVLSPDRRQVRSTTATEPERQP